MTKIKIFILERSIKILRKIALLLAAIPLFLLFLPSAHAAQYPLYLYSLYGFNSTSTLASGTYYFDSPSIVPEIDIYEGGLFTGYFVPASMGGGTYFFTATAPFGGNNSPDMVILDASGTAKNYFGDTSYALPDTLYLRDTISAGVSFVFPYSGETLQDFDSGTWDFDASGLSPGQQYISSVLYWEASSSITYQDSASFTDDISDRAFHITKQNYLEPGLWNASVELFLGSSTQSAGHDQITFTITATSTTPTAPSCNFTSSSFLGDPVGNIKQGICAALIWAFYPSGAQQADINGHFTALTDAVKNKPPFGYFQSITTGLGSFQATSTPSSTLLDSSGTAVFSNAFSGLDIGLAAILWFLFGWYIFHRMKNIEL